MNVTYRATGDHIPQEVGENLHLDVENEVVKGEPGEGIPGRGNSRWEGLEEGTSFTCLRVGNERDVVRD